MTIQGVYLEPVAIQSDEFKDFAARFQHRLVSLYEVNYAELVCGYLGDAAEWDSTAYYHGHFFSPLVTTATHFARNRSSKIYASNFLSIFICIARKIQSSDKGTHYYYVEDDSEILPVFIAIVRV
ncbi:hypothetical protein EC957_005553 [Mortierella hygrophila]|uniref:Uncharacterized protein n=1 Tax=Mortierella hygrophila TaxID=979708 RepID=A0A9P6F0T8_9FUNG|nr:hypothetical protein EC957_005553 [Mortierella hygrophila]